jgi:hypothetical protein
VVQLKLKNHPHLRLTARGGYWADDAAAAKMNP